MKSNLVSKSLTVLAVGFLSLSAMADGTPAMVRIANRLINSESAGFMFTGFQTALLRDTIFRNEGRNFDQSALYCGRFMVREGMGKFAGPIGDVAGLRTLILPNEIQVINASNRRETVISASGYCSADNSSELSLFTVRMVLNLEQNTGRILANTLDMNAESGI